MTQALRSIYVILVSLALFTAGSGMLGTLLGVRMAIEGFSHHSIGPILACYSFGFVLGTLYMVRVIRRVGHIRSFAAFAAIACISALAHPLWIDGVFWALLRAVTGFCGAGLVMVMESWINDRASNQIRGTIMATYAATSNLAQSSGQFGLGLGKPESYVLFSICAALIAASLVPLALTRSKAPLLESHERMGVRKLFDLAPIGIVGAFIAGVAMAGMMAVLPVYAQQEGYSVQSISLLMGIAVLASMATQWPVGRLSDRVDRRALIVLLALLGLLVSLPLSRQEGDSFMLLVALAAAFVGIAGTMYPMCVALTNDQLHSHQMVSASGTLLLIFGIGTIVGPVGGSLAMQYLGGAGLFTFLGAAMALVSAFGLYRYLRAKPIVVEEQAEYVPVSVVATPVIMEVDPRNPEFDPPVNMPPVERRTGIRDRRKDSQSGGRRRTDAADFNE
ncbi:MAG: MFS transporter [Xanthomonadaceae bacterium]|nr:MFS transporter [Xanthomonadaceae bacterium]